MLQDGDGDVSRRRWPGGRRTSRSWGTRRGAAWPAGTAGRCCGRARTAPVAGPAAAALGLGGLLLGDGHRGGSRSGLQDGGRTGWVGIAAGLGPTPRRAATARAGPVYAPPGAVRPFGPRSASRAAHAREPRRERSRTGPLRSAPHSGTDRRSPAGTAGPAGGPAGRRPGPAASGRVVAVERVGLLALRPSGCSARRSYSSRTSTTSSPVDRLRHRRHSPTQGPVTVPVTTMPPPTISSGVDLTSASARHRAAG